MIDVANEQLLTFSEAARMLPGHVHASTLHRWRLCGVRGLKLETVIVGGRRYTSREAIVRFSAAVTEARDGLPSPVRTPHQRQQSIARADHELEQAGI
jgi:hypothetical protein